MVKPFEIISIKTPSRIKPCGVKVKPTMVLGCSGVKGMGRLVVGGFEVGPPSSRLRRGEVGFVGVTVGGFFLSS